MDTGINCAACGHDVTEHVRTTPINGDVQTVCVCSCSSFEVEHIPSQQILYGQTYFLLPKSQVLDLVKDYVSKIEMELSAKWCKCEWITHPDDTEIDPHNCANCRHPHLLHKEFRIINEMESVEQTYNCRYSEGCPCAAWADPPKRRMRRGDQNPLCPVHTKEGLVLGFFEQLFPADKQE